MRRLEVYWRPAPWAAPWVGFGLPQTSDQRAHPVLSAVIPYCAPCCPDDVGGMRKLSLTASRHIHRFILCKHRSEVTAGEELVFLGEGGRHSPTNLAPTLFTKRSLISRSPTFFSSAPFCSLTEWYERHRHERDKRTVA